MAYKGIDNLVFYEDNVCLLQCPHCKAHTFYNIKTKNPTCHKCNGNLKEKDNAHTE